MRWRTVPIVLMLAFVSCQDQELAKVSKGLLVAAEVVGNLQTAVIDANSQHLISDADTAGILTVCVRVNLAGKSAVQVTRQIAKLNQPSRVQILEILSPVIREVSVLVKNGTAGIKNEQTKQKIQLILLSLESTLNTVQIILASGG